MKNRLEDYLNIVYSSLIGLNIELGGKKQDEYDRYYSHLCCSIRRYVVSSYASAEKGAEENPGNARYNGGRRYCIDDKRLLWCYH